MSPSVSNRKCWREQHQQITIEQQIPSYFTLFVLFYLRWILTTSWSIIFQKFVEPLNNLNLWTIWTFIQIWLHQFNSTFLFIYTRDSVIGSNFKEKQSNWRKILINVSIDSFGPLNPSVLTGSWATHGAPLILFYVDMM